jgi:hypothetical protein
MMRRLSGLVALAALGAAPLGAQRTNYAPLASLLPTGARALSLGGTTAASRDAEAALGNPALAGTIAQAGVSVARFQEGTGAGAAGMTTTVGVMGVGLAVSYLDYAPLFGASGRARLTDDVLWQPGAGAGASMAAAFSLSAAFKGWRWGAAASYLEERMESERASVAALTLGASRDGFFGNMTLGVAVQNIGPALQLGPDGDVDLPTRLAAGVSAPFFPVNAWFDLAATGGVAVRRDGFVSGSVGGELTYTPIEGIAFAFRAGVRRAEVRAERPLTGGVGASVDRFSLDYAWEQLREGGAHRIGLRIR